MALSVASVEKARKNARNRQSYRADLVVAVAGLVAGAVETGAPAGVVVAEIARADGIVVAVVVVVGTGPRAPGADSTSRSMISDAVSG
jgi:ammonia channel protein AmtB